jgi:hypothetical protein
VKGRLSGRAGQRAPLQSQPLVAAIGWFFSPSAEEDKSVPDLRTAAEQSEQDPPLPTHAAHRVRKGSGT